MDLPIGKDTPVRAGRCPFGYDRAFQKLAQECETEPAAPAEKVEIQAVQATKKAAPQNLANLAVSSEIAALQSKVGQYMGVGGAVTLRQVMQKFEKEGVTMQRTTRGLDFWRTHTKDVGSSDAARLFRAEKRLEVTIAGEKHPLTNVEELNKILDKLLATRVISDQSAALAATGQATAAATLGMTGSPLALGAQKPIQEAAPFAQVVDFLKPEESGVKKVGWLKLLTGIATNSGNPVEFFNKFHATHGEAFAARLPTGQRFLFDNRVDSVREALTVTDHPRKEQTWEKPPLQGHGLSFLLGYDNIFLGKGKGWKNMHGVMQPFLHSKAIHSDGVVKTMADTLDRHLDGLTEQIKKSPTGEIKIDVRPLMQRATLDVALQLLFSERLDDAELSKTQQAFQTLTKHLALETLNPTDISIGNLPGKGKLKEAYKTLTGLGDRVITERRASGNLGDDLLGGLLKATDPETGQPYSDERLRHEVLTLVLAGHETTATLLSWSLTEMARHPEDWKKLQAQVDAQVGKNVPTDKELMGVKAASNIVSETLRLYSPAYFLVREATEDTVVGPETSPTFVPKGTTMVMSTLHTHRNEETWGVEKTGHKADEFHPDRFELGRPGEMYPFGSGARVCLGQAMAKTEAALLLTRISQKFDIMPDVGAHQAFKSDISVHPKEPEIRLRLRD